MPVRAERWCWTVPWLLGHGKSLHVCRGNIVPHSEHHTEESSAVSMQRVMHLGQKAVEVPLTTAEKNHPLFNPPLG